MGAGTSAAGWRVLRCGSRALFLFTRLAAAGLGDSVSSVLESWRTGWRGARVDILSLGCGVSSGVTYKGLGHWREVELEQNCSEIGRNVVEGSKTTHGVTTKEQPVDSRKPACRLPQQRLQTSGARQHISTRTPPISQGQKPPSRLCRRSHRSPYPTPRS